MVLRMERNVNIEGLKSGYVNGNAVGLFYSYVGVPGGTQRLQIFWDEEGEPMEYENMSLGSGEASSDGLTKHTGVVQHVNRDITERTKKVVRANFIYEGKTGNCATVRLVTVTPSSDAPKGTATPSTPISCAALLVSKPTTPDGVYQIDPDGAAGPLGLISVFCDMTNDAGGWTRVINIKNGSIFHADQPAAVGDVSDVSAAAKLSDAVINLLNTVGYWRYECGVAKRSFVKNAENTWTSAKTNSFNWSMDNDKNLAFECPANRSGYTFADYPVCAAGHSNYAAVGGFGEGSGCYVDLEGWNKDGFLWAK